MFDFNFDGKVDAFDMALEYEFHKQVTEEVIISDEDKQLEDMGLDYDELMLMDDDERDEFLLDNDLDPDDFDF